MKCLAIADLFINAAMMDAGLKALKDKGITVEVREWSHESIENRRRIIYWLNSKAPKRWRCSAALLQGAEEVEILIVQFAPVNAAVFDKLPKLKYVGVLRGGIENVNQAEAKARGVEVMNTPGRNARSVAEFTVGMILAEMRNIARSHDALRDKFWRKESPNHRAIPELGGKVVVWSGWGAYRSAGGRLPARFRQRDYLYDKYVPGHDSYEKVDSLDELVRRADVISLHARMTPETET